MGAASSHEHSQGHRLRSATKEHTIANGPLRAPLSGIDFLCPQHDQSDTKMIEDTRSSSCCCRIKCATADCPEATKACQAVGICVGVVFNAHKTWATLKARPVWWSGAPGVKRCMKLDHDNRRNEWRSRRCDEFTSGNRLQFADALRRNSTGKLVFDIGFHDGRDTINMLELGYNVVAV